MGGKTYVVLLPSVNQLSIGFILCNLNLLSLWYIVF